ncbi:E2 ubiquitin-conjugating enzyme [Purpureocillium takamizusanense]|uniref:E2 ubiquitin-conjugating enzyme n=1 Tax=Purpureocillium takamizusanense TaxID=2060973 RepID=A0A9Q8QE88_9HYPO|nr:E2 ubiquitin-conjugating enzyme [Purpureocillium takamizusanense]UNI19179.1 E2 ubiquitin-conjugating enzyme [Purpureocillium takamizusanense]
MASATNNSTPQLSSKSPTIRRILREAAELSNSPSPDYTAEPLESDLFEWHFTLRGPPNSAYSEGVYHGRIVLPPTYPLRPPSFRFTTPNGRFEANREICLSISGHHEETWQPAWGIRTAIVALRSFMETDARGQLGGLDTTDAVRRRLAHESGSYACSTCGRTNADLIAESEKRAHEHASSASEEVQVPQELSMGWKDEMQARKDADSKATQGPGSSATPETRRDDESEGAELAEGFVTTAPPTQRTDENRQTVSPAGPPTQATQVQRAPSVTGQANNLHRRPQLQQILGAPNDGVPLWIDRAIVALVILLGAVLFKVLFGF